ncbi:hypothetical protein IMCC3317_03340 [Kordia antarctica]|uniref:Uncharacterized protein n=2 Tax=Kordia antarctica TaxID=1218801 RepID=A0A7L4ZDY9_9FLAO|nr:hypothetical protein IMCC3317_03340 [Kordia antarctica]
MLLLVVFFGCKPVHIITITKQKNVSGVPNGTPETNIYITLEVKKSVSIHIISLGLDNLLKNYSIYNLDNGLILKPTDILTKGNYYIQISSKENSFFNDAKEIYVTYSLNGKVNIVKSTIKVSDDLLMKSSN